MSVRVQVKNSSGCERVLAIDVSEEWVAEEYTTFYQAVGKRATIPGFRPGHAPPHVVRMRYQKEAREEVLKRLVARSFREAVREGEMRLVGQPRIELIEFDERHLKFNAHVALRPTIKMEPYAGLVLERTVAGVRESEIEAVLRRLQEAQAQYHPVEGRGTQLGDFLICDYQLQVGDQEVGREQGIWLPLRDDEYLKGFSHQLLGARVGECKHVTVTLPSDYPRKELSGKEARFWVTVREIKERILPPLDDELAKASGVGETLQAMREAIRKDLEGAKIKEADRLLEQTVMNELLKRSKFEVPKGLVKSRSDFLVEDEMRSRLRRGVKEEDARQDRDVLQKSLYPIAEKQVRLSFILEEVAKREHISVGEVDLEERFQSIAEHTRRPLEEVKGYYARNETEKDSLAIQILNEKTIEWIKGKATITDRVSKEEAKDERLPGTDGDCAERPWGTGV